MKRVLFIVLTPIWLFVLFLVVFRVTFPSQPLIDFAEYHVSDATDGTMAISIDSVSPAFVGLRGSDVLLSSVDDGVGTPILAVESLKVGVGVLSAISGSPKVSGTARFGDGNLDFDGVIAADEEGVYDLRELDVDTTAFPIGALPPIQGTKILGTGGFDLGVDLEMPDGYANANGRASLSGANIELTGVSGDMNALVTGFGILPATLERLDLEFDVREGTAEVRRGTLVSTLADVTIEGDIVLTNRISNSRLRLDITIDAKEPLAGVSSMMNSAKWSSDDKYHYELRGTFNRPRFTAARDRNASSSRRRNRRPRRGGNDDAADDEEEDDSPRASRARARRDRASRARPETLEAARQARDQISRRVPGVNERPVRELGGDEPSLIAPDEAEEGGGDTAEPPAAGEEEAE